MRDDELSAEIKRLTEQFSGGDAKKLEALSGMIEQAAFETLYLKRLNEQAILSGLVKIHPENASMQRALPVSAEIARHSATLTNILDKLCKHLGNSGEDDYDDLSEFE